MDTAMAASSHMLRQGGCATRLAFSDNAFSALNISTTTSTCKFVCCAQKTTCRHSITK